MQRRTWSVLPVSLALVSALFIACGGSSNDEGDDASSASTVRAEDEIPTEVADSEEETPTRAATTAATREVTTAATRPPSASPTSNPANRTAAEWMHEVCILAGNFGKVGTASSTLIANTDINAAGAHATISAEYQEIADALKVYASAVEAMPATTDEGGDVFKNFWVAAAWMAYSQNQQNAELVKALPQSVEEFPSAYDELVRDYRLDFGDGSLEGDLHNLRSEYDTTASEILDTAYTDPACAGIFDA